MAGRCETFARLMAKELGISYRDATKMYWQRSRQEVWVGAVGPIHSARGHCVHCARADAMQKYPPEVVKKNRW